MKTFHLDIITPTTTFSFEDVTYLRIPSLDGLIGIRARHSTAIIGLDIGEIKITINGKDEIYATSGGFSDIKPEGVQLLLESVENINTIDKDRASEAFNRAKKKIKDKTASQKRAMEAIKRAKNRLNLVKKI